jgi:endonuclease G
VIGNPPAISVPTHFAKVVLAARGSPGGFAPGPSSGLPVSGPMGKDVAIGAFVLPNSVIPDNTPLTEFSVPGGSHRDVALV